jgi:hypothetical protein
VKADDRAIFEDDSRYLDRFGLLLALTVTSVILLSLVDLSEVPSDRLQQAAALVTSFLTALALLVALRAAGVKRRWQRVADILVVVGMVLSALLLIAAGAETTSAGAARTPPVFALVLATLAPVVVVRRLLAHRRVRPQTLLGAVAVYVLIAVAFFYAFLTVEVTQSSDFFGNAEPTSDLMYFSLTTLTTVGFGDLVAVGQPGRLLANAEAVIGQLYLVTFVGLLIGILTQQNRGVDG